MQIAGEIDRAPGTVRNWERGHASPGPAILPVYARALGVDVEDLFEDPDPALHAATAERARPPAENPEPVRMGGNRWVLGNSSPAEPGKDHRGNSGP